VGRPGPRPPLDPQLCGDDRPGGFAALAATLSLPAVEVLVRGEHLVVRENGELLASGRPPAAAPPERL
jgi:hypothetical protein